MKRLWDLGVSLLGAAVMFAIPGIFMGLCILFGDKFTRALGDSLGAARSTTRLLITLGYMFGTSLVALGIVAVAAMGAWWILGRMGRIAAALDLPQPRGAPTAAPSEAPERPAQRHPRSRSRLRGIGGGGSR